MVIVKDLELAAIHQTIDNKRRDVGHYFLQIGNIQKIYGIEGGFDAV